MPAPMIGLAAGLLGALLPAVAAQTSGVTLTPNISAIGASQILSPSFAGLGIEPSNLYSFTGSEHHPNELTITLLTNLANYTGVPPHFRIGGNTGDNVIYDESFTRWVFLLNDNSTGQGAIPSDRYIFGPSYFEALNRFPVGTPITFGLNLAYTGDDYIERIVAEANASRSILTQAVLVSFEIGNEPNLYLQNGFRTGAWDSNVYAQEWLDRAEAVYTQVLKPYNISATFFEPGCTATTIGNSFSIDQLSNTGILTPSSSAVDNKTFVSAWNQHDYYYYINISSYILTIQNLMDFSNTPLQFAAWDQQVNYAEVTNIPYVLREMASVGPVGESGISDVFGAALWTLNFFLYTASLNISSVQMHMTDNSFASPWLPIPMYGVSPFVRPTYYAWAAMDQIIGGGCATRVQPLPISTFPTDYTNNLIAYSFYRNDALAGMVILNSKISNTSETDKASVTFTFNLPDFSGQTVYLSYMSASGTDALTNVTWNGISYEQDSIGTPTTVGDSFPETATVNLSGVLTVSVRDTQAVVAAFGQKIGTGPYAQYNESACQALGATKADPSSYSTPTQILASASASATSPDGSTNSGSSTGPDTTTNGGHVSAASSYRAVDIAVALGVAMVLGAAITLA